MYIFTVTYSADTQIMAAKALFSLYFHFFFTYFNYFFSTTGQPQPRVDAMAETLFLPFSTLFSKWRRDFARQRRHFSTFFRRFLSITVGPLLTIAGYFIRETIMALSDGNITTFSIQRQGTNGTQHIYFGGRCKTTIGTQHNTALFTIGKTTSTLP